MQENWENQKAALAEKSYQEYVMQGGEFPEAAKEHFLENSSILHDSKHSRAYGLGKIKMETPAEKAARLKYAQDWHAQKYKMMREPSAGESTLSYSTGPDESDSPEAERNANRQTAPVGWEVDAGQGRGAVLGILGGRSRRR